MAQLGQSVLKGFANSSVHPLPSANPMMSAHSPASWSMSISHTPSSIRASWPCSRGLSGPGTAASVIDASEG